MKQILKSLLTNTGTGTGSAEKIIPVEFTADDQGLIQYVRSNELTMVSDERLYATLLACKHVLDAGIPGDFVECGVWRGGNAVLAAGCFKNTGSERCIHLFDTFAGMTEPTAEDVTYRGKDAKRVYDVKQQDDHNAWCYAALDEVQGHFEKAGLLSERVRFIQGDVLETLQLAENLPETIAVLRLDTDWYESTKAELEILYPRLSPGGIIILDDYGHWGGCKKAVDEYFQRHGNRPYFQINDYTGRSGVKVA